MLPDEMKTTYEKLGIPEAERKFLAGVTAQYECLRGSTRVWTTDGMLPIKELVAGDRGLLARRDHASRSSKPKCVGAAQLGRQGDLRDHRPRSRRSAPRRTIPFLVLRDERKAGPSAPRYAARWLPVEDLQVGDLVAIATDVPEFGDSAPLDGARARPRTRSRVSTDDDLCWWAGLYLGDGYLKHSGGYTTVEIAVDQSDTVLVDEIVG